MKLLGYLLFALTFPIFLILVILTLTIDEYCKSLVSKKIIRTLDDILLKYINIVYYTGVL